jgi:hypothetical protein
VVSAATALAAALTAVSRAWSAELTSVLSHFLNTKYTANIRQKNAARWFHFNSILNAIMEKMVNTASVITS